MNTDSADRRTLIESFVREISKAQRERAERPHPTEAGELGWVAFERDKLLGLINQELAKLGKPQVEMSAVVRIEDSAVGHVDYTQKLAIRAVELVFAG